MRFKEVILKKLLWMIFAILLLPVCANATTMDFYSNGTITDGNVFDTVNVWNDANVTMTGGDIGFCKVYDSGVFNYDGGDLGFLYVNNYSIAHISTNGCQVFELYDNSQIHIDNGSWANSVQIFDNAELHIYGYSLKYILAGPDWIEGFWQPNSQFFRISLRNSPMGVLRDNVFLHEIPEPVTFGLFGIGFLILRRAIKTSHKY